MKNMGKIYLLIPLFLAVFGFSFFLAFGQGNFFKTDKSGNKGGSAIARENDLKDKSADNSKNYKNIMDNKPVKILFAGDLMLDRYNREIIERYGASHFTQKISSLFENQDLKVANLEGPVSDNRSVSVNTENGNPGHMKFTFDRKSASDFLESSGINAVNLGNNHILNFGESGAGETVDFLTQAGIGYFGSPLDPRNSYIEKEINGIKIALVNYNKFYKEDLENTLNKVREAKSKNEFVIVYAHWGSEYKLIQSQKQADSAHLLIDSGADLIIGSHPHVVQPVEIYKGKAIFYSLGNFVFDQYFSEDVKNELLVAVSVSRERFDFTLFPLYTGRDGSLSLSEGEIRRELLERIAGDSQAPDPVKAGIREGKFSLKIPAGS
ncbi:MAG: CapA family protein [Parcubacteria group bacterium]|jgi:poly-gamma-glutamate synthesis protein (capsule biosynthesis protein)|nr:CapA family protein [Candidatus Moranbacteria bacterium]MDX9856153.1 CapA family protein [Candidatus Moranbacteria bacterium]